MIGALLMLLASGASELSHQYQKDWQRCLIQTSELWANKKLPADYVFDAALIYCRDREELMMITTMDDMAAIGLSVGQAKEAASFLAASLLGLNRGFALDAISKARAKD